MKKYISNSLFYILSFLIVGIFSFTGVSSSSANGYYNSNTSYQGQGANCPSYYHPVCGEKAGTQTVYQNICTMNSAGATFVQWKTCGYTSNTNYSNNHANNWYYQQPVYTYPIYISQPVCSQEYAPVCASKNGYKKSYSNACFARQNGAFVLNSGSCEQKVRQKITCYFSDSTTSQNCKIVNGTSRESCSGKTSCSFWTSSRKKGTYVEIKNTCDSSQYIEISGNSKKIYNQCRPEYLCSLPQTVYCGYNQQKVFQGYDSNGCNKGYKCVNIEPYYQYNSSYNYTPYYQPQNSYNPTFSLSRDRGNLAGTVSSNTVFTVKIYTGASGSTITHFIPNGIELLQVTKGNCEKTRVYGGTRLKCRNVDSIEYRAKSGHSVCQKKFTTTFSNYNYNSQYRKFSLTVR